MATSKQRKLIVTRAVRMIKSGDTITQAAEKLGMNKNTLGVWLHQQGVKLRPDTTQRNIVIRDEYQKGIPVSDIAKKFNLTESHVYRTLVNGEGSLPPIKDSYDMTFTEIAKVMGIGEEAVRKDYHRAMKKLKVLVVEFDLELEDVVAVDDRWRME